MSLPILKIVGDASCMQPETSSVSASERNPSEAIAETSLFGVNRSPTCVDGPNISDEEEEEAETPIGVIYSPTCVDGPYISDEEEEVIYSPTCVDGPYIYTSDEEEYISDEEEEEAGTPIGVIHSPNISDEEEEAETPIGVIRSRTCVDGSKISEEEEEGEGTGSGNSDPVNSNPRLRYLYLEEAISRKGFKVKTNWWESNFSHIDAVSSSDTHALSITFERLLYSDMNLYGGGVLPHNVGYMPVEVLVGPCVLQVEAIVDVGWPSRRCLQLSMTDGVHHVIGLECRPIENLQVFDPAGLKILVFNLPVRHGFLMLAPESAVVLGGRVVKLEQEPQMPEVNKPPTQAAWSLNDNAPGDHVNSSTTTNASHTQATGQGVPLNVTHISTLMTNDRYAFIEATFARIESMQRDRESSFVEVDEMVCESEVSNMVELESESEWKTLPFTDFAGLTEKCALTEDPMHYVRGVIMGCVDGIKVLGFKPSEYNVVFYVREGYIKHEILLHDGFVEKFLGQSAVDVYRAPSSSLAEDLKRLMLFLNFFQGMMVVEMNRSSQYPVAVEMIEGCSLTAAKLLFERITSSTTTSCN